VATDFGEEHAGRVLLVDIAADEEPVVTELTVGKWIFLEQIFEFNQAEDVDALTSWLSGLSDKERTIIRLALRGSLSLADKARLDETLTGNAELFAALNLWESHSDLVMVPDGLDLEQMDLSGYALEAYEELAGQAKQAGEEGRCAVEALTLLYRLQRGGDQ
jgi:hypothetical protein